MAREFDLQDAEVRIAVLNGYTALGIPATEAVDQPLGEERGAPPIRTCASELQMGMKSRAQ